MLSAAEIDRFEREGYLHLRAAIPREVTVQCRRLADEQLGIASDPQTWAGPVLRGLVGGEPLRDAANTPQLLEAVGQLLDGEDWSPRPNLGLFVVWFPSERDPADAGWHIDSSYQRPGRDEWFVNYRSRARGLLLLCLLSDVGADEAPTRIRPGSHTGVPPLLRRFGDEGVVGQHAPLPQASQSVEIATGQAGDVFLCHPFLVHAATWPHRGTAPRYVAQPPISLTGSLHLDGDPVGLSPVARTVRATLGDS